MKTSSRLRRTCSFSTFAVSLVAPVVFGQSTSDAINRYAYAANAGWVDFRPSDPDGVIVGEAFPAGYAYAANFGWIHLGAGYLATDTIICPDFDSDGIGDPWERGYFTTLKVADGTNSSLGAFAPDAGATTTRVVPYPANDLKFFHVVAKKPLVPPPP